MNPALSDELTTINSIFDSSTLLSTSIEPAICTLRLPSLPSVSIRVEFPTDYPDAPPSILGTETVGNDVQKGVGNQVVQLVRGVLAQVYRPGEPCIFDLLEEVREGLEQIEEQGHINIHDHHGTNEDPERRARDLQHIDEIDVADLQGPGVGVSEEEEPPWSLSAPLTEKKSVFLARCAPVSSPTQAKSYLSHLVTSDKKVAKATHNITAWRIRGANGATYQDCDDDGETAAGGRILHLMQLMDVWDVMVVVTRWYGGIHLGPDRFRIINSVAREALVVGGFVREGEIKKKGKK
ncbi:impact family protein [Glonium stellatum]|uniref:Impact family protein n=1 Tax=Glonium stellatum TaxID=574774 RepID=A0A8E2F2P8_9PEZI|nr:impact family protein [Glonium stellatum]